MEMLMLLFLVLLINYKKKIIFINYLSKYNINNISFFGEKK